MSAASLQALRVAVVGLGSIGRRHLENLDRLGVADRVVVRRPQRANAAFEPPAGVAVAHSLQEALGARLDAAIICNPTSLHVETALAYLDAGVSVLIEKPIAHRLDDAERLIAAAKRRGACAGMAYAMRYHPAYRLARDAIAEGRLGRTLYAKVWFEAYLPDWHPWEDYRQGYAARRDLGGGALPTLDHELDFLNWCLGQAERAEGRSGRSGALEMDADDWATLSMRYPGEVMAGGTFSLCRRDRSRGFEFIGERATLRFHFETGQLELLRGGERGAQLLWNGAGYDLNDMYLEMLRDFLGALVGRRRQAPVPLEAGLHALRVAEGAIGGWRGEICNAQIEMSP
jgi:predicted dehydrogenase